MEENLTIAAALGMSIAAVVKADQRSWQKAPNYHLQRAQAENYSHATVWRMDSACHTTAKTVQERCWPWGRCNWKRKLDGCVDLRTCFKRTKSNKDISSGDINKSNTKANYIKANKHLINLTHTKQHSTDIPSPLATSDCTDSTLHSSDTARRSGTKRGAAKQTTASAQTSKLVKKKQNKLLTEAMWSKHCYWPAHAYYRQHDGGGGSKIKIKPYFQRMRRRHWRDVNSKWSVVLKQMQTLKRDGQLLWCEGYEILHWCKEDNKWNKSFITKWQFCNS